jgi:prolyl-tRNA synthetase
MTRLSAYFLPTEKQAPADAEALSHKLLVRAGMIRQVGAGLWTWLPAGWRVHQRVSQIIREEMDAVGALEMLMPVLLPAEPWRRSGRYGIEELFKLKDRKGADLVLAMTHEEIVTQHVAQVVRSYRDLPLTLYHIQTKERDEPRPRAGVLRTREFTMKDAYTFDRDAAGLDERYEQQAGAYARIMERCGLRYYRVEADVGMMGGLGADEFMAPCAAGENEIALAAGYAANVEVARAQPQVVELPPRLDAPEEVATPGLTTVAEVAGALEVTPGALLKAYPVVSEQQGLVMAVVRGDHRVNDIKLTNALHSPWRPAQESEIAGAIGPPGFIGPVGLDGSVRVLLDEAVTDGGYVTGANRADAHLRGVEPGRDFGFERADFRNVEAGDTVNGHAITIEPAIEVGNIFKLGTRYSEPFEATYLDENGHEELIWMGSYGLGPARIAAATVEQTADEHGISWPRSLAPFDVHLVGLGRPDSPEHQLAEDVYATLVEGGVDALYDDRDAGAGEKFADAELLGCPLRLTIGKRSVENAAIEVQRRRGREDEEPVAIEPRSAIAERVRELLQELP